MTDPPTQTRLLPAEGVRPPTAAYVRALAGRTAFGGALVVNSLRGLVSETIVAAALEPEWECCSEDWGGWDFGRDDGLRLEVKQSADLQTWTKAIPGRNVARFDIKARTGRRVPDNWQTVAYRAAHIYVFAHHFVSDDNADHCDPNQWRFYVVAACDLPSGKEIGIRPLEKLTTACSFSALCDTVRICASVLISKFGTPSRR